MKKSVRVTLYVLSLLMVAGVFVLIIFSGRTKKTDSSDVKPTMDVTVEETVTEEEVAAPTEEAETETELVAETEEPQKDTVLMFAGDVMLAHQVFEANYEAEGITGILSKELLTEMQEADILMVNHEFAFSTQGSPEDKQYTFRSDPKYVTTLNEMGVDIVTLANNHALDYGKVALSDTFQTLDGAGILYSGAGETVERAEELQIIEANGKKFGFLSASRVVPNANWKVEYSAPGLFTAYDYHRLVELVEEADSQCDYLTVYVHWGVERDAYPQDYQTAIANACVEAGADLIVGSHPHCLQGIEYMNGKPVYYSLGNFIFGYGIERTAALKVTIGADDSVTFQLLPAFAANGKTQLMEAGAASDVYDYMEEISVNAQVDENGYVTER